VADRPAVSVIIPNRDSAGSLPRALASVGYAPDIEIVVVDDASTDGSRAWLATEAQRDSRLRVLAGSGGGPAKARNLAIGAARGRLLAFLNARDCWHPDKLSAQLALHRANAELAFSFTDSREVDADGADLGAGFAAWPWFQARYLGQSDPFVLAPDALAQIYAEAVVVTSTVLARADLVRELGGFDPDLPTTEAWDLWLRLAGRGPVGCVPRVLVDRAAQQPQDGAGAMRGRVLGMRMIEARHAAAAERLSPRAARVFAARLLNADADLAATADRRWRAAWLRVNAWRQSPNREATRAAAGAVLHAMTSA
jgi:glycosyltransferase involved in cell wall biosynthesis